MTITDFFLSEDISDAPDPGMTPGFLLCQCQLCGFSGRLGWGSSGSQPYRNAVSAVRKLSDAHLVHQCRPNEIGLLKILGCTQGDPETRKDLN